MSLLGHFKPNQLRPIRHPLGDEGPEFFHQLFARATFRGCGEGVPAPGPVTVAGHGFDQDADLHGMLLLPRAVSRTRRVTDNSDRSRPDRDTRRSPPATPRASG